MTEQETEIEFDESELYEGPPDDLDRGDPNLQDDESEGGLAARAFAGPVQRSVSGMINWYNSHRTRSTLGYNPDGMCLKICRQSRNIAAKYPSALKAQQATPAKHRITRIRDIKIGHFMYFDDPRDGNPYGHIVGVVGRVKGVSLDSLDSIVTETNSVKRGEVTRVRASYFPRYWGDKFVFATDWLNGVALNMPAPAPVKPPAKTTTIDIIIRECSMQYSDPIEQKRLDAKTAFLGLPHVILFTEVGRGQNAEGQALLRKQGERLGYAMYFDGFEGGIAVRFKSGKVVAHDYLGPIIKGKAGDHPHLGLNWVTVDHTAIGVMTFGVMHWLNRDKEPARAKANDEATEEATAFLEKKAAGDALGFLGGDANRDDRTRDVLPGVDWTTAADELKEWVATHGSRAIDFIASYDKDVRVKAKSIRKIRSRTYSDHSWIEVVYTITIP